MEVKVEGLKELRRLLKPPDELLAAPWKQAMHALAEQGERDAKAAAPVRSGKLRSKIVGRVQKGNFPKWLAVRSRGTRKVPAGSQSRSAMQFPRGYPYPRVLNYGARYGHKGWFDHATANMVAKAEAALAQAGNEIQKVWARR